MLLAAVLPCQDGLLAHWNGKPRHSPPSLMVRHSNSEVTNRFRNLSVEQGASRSSPDFSVIPLVLRRGRHREWKEVSEEPVQAVFRRSNGLGLSLKCGDDRKLESTSWE